MAGAGHLLGKRAASRSAGGSPEATAHEACHSQSLPSLRRPHDGSRYRLSEVSRGCPQPAVDCDAVVPHPSQPAPFKRLSHNSGIGPSAPSMGEDWGGDVMVTLLISSSKANSVASPHYPPHPRIRSGAGSNPLPLGERGYSETAFQGGRGYAEVSTLGMTPSVVGMLDHVPLAVLRARLVLGLVHDVHADRLAPCG